MWDVLKDAGAVAAFSAAGLGLLVVVAGLGYVLLAVASTWMGQDKRKRVDVVLKSILDLLKLMLRHRPPPGPEAPSDREGVTAGR